MSKTGEWGDKIIVTLRGDGVRRHKKWCENYREGNLCAAPCGKCIGSAHCDYYKSKTKEEGVYTYSALPEEDPVKPTKPVGEQTEKPSVPVYREYYRRATWGDKLLDKTVLIKTTALTFRIADVTKEALLTFTAEYDGREHRYDKMIAYKKGIVYVFTGMEMVTAEEKETAEE